MTIGTNYALDNNYYQYGTINKNSYLQNNYHTGKISYADDSFASSVIGDNTCTDGKDDGKIGFFSALGNAVQGVGKTIVGGIKGMFTNKEGKFSLGKTLLSVGMAAACIAFPAVGVAACAVGGVMGAAKIGKGIYNAANATTDAEAKQAWEDIGGGTFTVAASVVGAKAGVKAVKNTSSAGALEALGKDATLREQAVALGKDMVSSTKNQATIVKDAAINLYNSKGEILNSAKDLANTAKSKVTKENIGKLYDGAKAKLKELNISKTIKSAPAKIKNIITEMKDGSTTYSQAVQKYGYENVAEALKYIAGTEYSLNKV